MYIIIISERGDRTNILAGFKVLSLEQFIKMDKTTIDGSLRYAEVDSEFGCSHFKYMDMESFQDMFIDKNGKVLLEPQFIKDNFPKSINEKYGTGIEKIDYLKSKDVVAGRVYKDKNGELSLYLGKVLYTFRYGRNDDTQYPVHLYYSGYGLYKLIKETKDGFKWKRKKSFNEIVDLVMDRESYYIEPCDVTKTKRRYVEEISSVEPIDIIKGDYIKYKKNGNGYNSKVYESKDCYIQLIF